MSDEPPDPNVPTIEQAMSEAVVEVNEKYQLLESECRLLDAKAMFEGRGGTTPSLQRLLMRAYNQVWEREKAIRLDHPVKPDSALYPFDLVDFVAKHELLDCIESLRAWKERMPASLELVQAMETTSGQLVAGRPKATGERLGAARPENESSLPPPFMYLPPEKEPASER